MWIVTVAGFTLLSGLFLGNAFDAHLLAAEAQRTRSFDEGWKPFHDHLSQIADRSAWIGLLFLVIATFALPRARRVVRSYFPAVKMLQATSGSLLLAGILLLGGIAGFMLGAFMDRAMTGVGLSGT